MLGKGEDQSIVRAKSVLPSRMLADLVGERNWSLWSVCSYFCAKSKIQV
jgi:hypothetical protein